MFSRREFISQTGLATAGLLTPNLGFSALATYEDTRFTELKKAISAHAGTLKIPGLIAAVVEKGNVNMLHTHGFADVAKKTPIKPDSIFPVASLTKTFAAVTLAMYEQEGKISLDDYVLDYTFLPLGLTSDRLYTPNLQLKHVLSHTSEGQPGSNYMYSGNRYSFVYGVFEKMSGNTKHYEAFADEVTKKILRPLHMESTLPGYPADKNHPAIPRIVTTYNWDREHQNFNPDTGLPGQTTLFPSTGMLTSIDDLVTYTNALDRNTLLNAASYQKITTPFATLSGHPCPYGLGWSVQEIDGRKVHWHYGYGDSYAALIIRIPEAQLTFILLSNSAQVSEPFVLGYGNLLSSVFAQSFFKHVVARRRGQFQYAGFSGKTAAAKDAMYYNELYSQALMRFYTAETFKAHQGEAVELMKYLSKHDPARFDKVDLSLIHLLARLAEPSLSPSMEQAIKAYTASKWFHADIHDLIAGWYKQNGNWPKALEWYHALADSEGYGEQGGVKNACKTLGLYYLEHGETEKGRSYLWRGVTYSPGDAADRINLMNSKKR